MEVEQQVAEAKQLVAAWNDIVGGLDLDIMVEHQVREEIALHAGAVKTVTVVLRHARKTWATKYLCLTIESA